MRRLKPNKAVLLIELIILIAILVMTGCQSGNNIDLLKEQVMAVHDEVMPKMGELRKVEKSLRELSPGNPDSVVIITEANAIKAASDGMMQWMRNYEPDFEGSEEEYIEYLNTQMKEIEKVRDDMNSSLEAGKQRLN